jgi:hypothetical protein
MTDELGTPDEGAESRPVRTSGQPGNAKARADEQQGAAPAPKKISDAPEPPEIVNGRYVSREPDENESEPPARPPRRVSRAPDPSPRIPYSCTPREPKQKEPKPDADLIDAECQCEGLINAWRRRSKFRGPRWDVEKKRWPFYRKRIDEGLVRCGLSDDAAYRRKIDKLDHEWGVVCEYRETLTAAPDDADLASKVLHLEAELRSRDTELRNEKDTHYLAGVLHLAKIRKKEAEHQQEVDALKGESIRAELVRAYFEREERQQRAEDERRAAFVARITGWLGKPDLMNRTHFRVSEIIEDRLKAHPERRAAAYLDAFEAAVKAGLFNEGKRKRTQLVCVDDSGKGRRLTKDFLAMYLGEAGDTANEVADAIAARDAAIKELLMDPAACRAQRLEDLAERTWMPRRFIARWLTGYNLLPLPFWLLGTAEAIAISPSLLDKLAVPAGRALAYTREELTETAGWTRPPRQVYSFPKPAEPVGAGVMPLVNAGFWIASQGGAIDVTTRSEAGLIAAFEVLIKRLIDDGAALRGRNLEGRDEDFPASNLQGLDLHYTDTVLAFPADLPTADELTTLSETDETRWHKAEERRQFWERQNRLQPGGKFGFIEIAFCPDGYFWNELDNDKLFRAGRELPLWTNIQVSQEFVRTHWPFHLHGNCSAPDYDERSGGPLPFEKEGSEDEELTERYANVEVPTPEQGQGDNLEEGDGFQPFPWKIPPDRPARSRPAVLVAWIAMNSVDSWRAHGIPRRLPSGEARSIKALTEHINKIILPKIRNQIDNDVLSRLPGPISETTVKRALGLRDC